MREGWIELNFLDSINKINNTTKISKKSFLKEGKYPIVSQENSYINGYWNKEKDIFKVSKPVIIFGDHTKKIKYINFDFVLGADGVKILLPKDNIDSRFFYYQLQSLNIRHLGYARHYRLLKEFKIKVPPLQEQTQIVKTLDIAFKQIDQAKANLEQNLHNAKELFASKLNEVFSQRGEGWEEKSFSEICKITSKLVDPKELQYQNLLHIGAGNIESEKGILSNLKTAKEENLISGKFIFNKEMVLYSKIRPYLMKVVKCDFIGLCSADIYPLLPIKTEITQDFLYYLLLSNRFTTYAIEGSQRAGMPKVNRKHLFNYVCFLPNIDVQISIVETLDIIFDKSLNLQTHYQQKLNNLEELKKSILQKAFRGEL